MAMTQELSSSEVSPSEIFPPKVTKFPCADDPEALRQFGQVIEKLQARSPVEMPSQPGLEGRYGYYFSIFGRNGESNAPAEHGFLNGVAISRDRTAKVCRVEALLNNDQDPRVFDSMLHLWTKAILPRFSRVVDFSAPQIFTGTEATEIHFPAITDPNVGHLLSIMGLPNEDTSGWYIPIPQETIVGPEDEIQGWMEGDRGLKHAALVALNGEGTPSGVRFFENGRYLGKLTASLMELALEDFGPGVAKAFRDPAARRQLGFVSLKRSPPAPEELPPELPRVERLPEPESLPETD